MKIKYYCAYCNYQTDRHFSYQKHLITKKHIRNCNKQTKNVPLAHKKSSSVKKLCKCNYCGNYYSNASSLARHRTICAEKETIKLSHIEEIEKLDQEIKRLKEQHQYSLDLYEQLHKQQRAEINRLYLLIENAGGVIKTSVSALSHVVKNYNNSNNDQLIDE